MRTVTFKSVLDWVASKALGHPLLMGQEEAETYTRYINDAVREFWEREPWPEWSPIEQRYYAPEYVELTAGAPWPVGQIVYHESSYWRALQAVHDVEPGTDADFWEEVDDLDYVIPLAQTYRLPFSLTASARTPIGTLFGISPTDPRINPRNFVSIASLFSPDGITLFDSAAGNSVWLHFRLPPPEFTATIWASGTHAAGARVYYPTTGECYLALVDNTNGPVTLARADITLADAEVTLATADYTALPTDTTRWQKIDFPYVLAPAVQRMAYADALEDDGQHDKAYRVREEAEERLGMEWAKSEGQQGITRTYRVLSR